MFSSFFLIPKLHQFICEHRQQRERANLSLVQENAVIEVVVDDQQCDCPEQQLGLEGGNVSSKENEDDDNGSSRPQGAAASAAAANTCVDFDFLHSDLPSDDTTNIEECFSSEEDDVDGLFDLCLSESGFSSDGLEGTNIVVSIQLDNSPSIPKLVRSAERLIRQGCFDEMDHPMKEEINTNSLLLLPPNSANDQRRLSRESHASDVTMVPPSPLHSDAKFEIPIFSHNGSLDMEKRKCSFPAPIVCPSGPIPARFLLKVDYEEANELQNQQKQKQFDSSSVFSNVLSFSEKCTPLNEPMNFNLERIPYRFQRTMPDIDWE